MRFRTCSFLPILLMGSFLGVQQEKPPASSQDSPQEVLVFRAEANLVLLRFHVMRDGNFVDTISQEQVRILEDGKPQEIVVFDGPQSSRRLLPVEMIIVLDVSLSVMNWALLDGRMLETTILAALDENATISIWAFAEQLKQFCQPSREVGVLNEGLKAAFKFENLGTRLYEAIEGTLHAVSQTRSPGLRVMIIFSDGFATDKQSSDDSIDLAREYDIKLYPVVLGHDRSFRAASRKGRGGVSDSYWRERQMERFSDLGELTAGRNFDPPGINPRTIKAILENVVAEVRTEYVVGYYPAPAVKKGKHKAKVVLADKSLGKIKGGEKEYRR